jgi:flagellar biosynthesis protein FlhG
MSPTSEPVIATVHADQAASLRRLVGSHGGRTVALTGGPGTGVTTLAINLAHALSRDTAAVLLLDEDDSLHGAIARLQLRRRFDFSHAASRDVRLDELLLQGPGFVLMPLAIPVSLSAHLPPGRQGQLADEYDSLIARIDWVLADARPIGPETPPGLALAADEVLVVITPSGESITEAYAAIKRLHTEYGRRDFRILANRVRTLDTALALFQRVREVASRFLDVKMKLVGFVPEDEALMRANRLGEPVSGAFPGAESGIAFAQLAQAMQRWPRKTGNLDRANLLYRAIDIGRRFALPVR